MISENNKLCNKIAFSDNYASNSYYGKDLFIIYTIYNFLKSNLFFSYIFSLKYEGNKKRWKSQAKTEKIGEFFSHIWYAASVKS